jgi:uncharacterized protein (TIGR02453 family)
MPRRQPPPPAAGWTGFDPAALTFLRQLRRHNTREWFESNRERYHRLVRDPLRAFIEEFDVLLATELPEVMGDPRRSAFRIHRDVRFSKDKAPYKTHASCWFYHRDAGKGVGQEAHGGAGLYVHLEPGASMVAAGIWMPPKPALDRIREALLDDHEPFEAILTARPFRRRYGALSTEAMLVRHPRGTDPDHPAARWLKYKSFTVHRMLDDAAITDPRLVQRLAPDVTALRPLVRWLNAALGFPALASRR